MIVRIHDSYGQVCIRFLGTHAEHYDIDASSAYHNEKVAMTIHPMHTEADHTIALKRIEKIFDEPRGSLQEDELEIPGIIAEEYGRRHFPIEAPDPIEAITFAMEQAGPAGTLGSRSGNSQILAGNRNLAISMTRKLYASLNIPADMQIRKTVR